MTEVNFNVDIKSKSEEIDGYEKVTGFKVVGTPYEDTVLAGGAKGIAKGNSQDVFYEAKGSYNGSNDDGINTFTGRDGATVSGKDGVILSGIFSRYDIKYNKSNDTWLITDSYQGLDGGDGITKATDLERIEFGEIFSLKIGGVFDGTKDNDNSTKDNVKLTYQVQNPEWEVSEFGQLSGADAKGYSYLLTEVNKDVDGIGVTAGSKY